MPVFKGVEIRKGISREDAKMLMGHPEGRRMIAEFLLSEKEREMRMQEEDSVPSEGIVLPWSVEQEVQYTMTVCFPGLKIRSGNGHSGYSLIEHHNNVIMHQLCEQFFPTEDNKVIVYGADLRFISGQYAPFVHGVTAIDSIATQTCYTVSSDTINRTVKTDFGRGNAAALDGNGENFTAKDEYSNEVSGLIFDMFHLNAGLHQIALSMLDHETDGIIPSAMFTVPFAMNILVDSEGEIPVVSMRFKKFSSRIVFYSAEAQFEYDWKTYLELVATTVFVHPMFKDRKFWIERRQVHPGIFVGMVRGGEISPVDNLDSYKVAWFSGMGGTDRVVRTYLFQDSTWIEKDVLVDGKLYDGVSEIAATMDPEQFTRDNILERLRTTSQIQVIQGKVVRLGTVLDPATLAGVMASIYVEKYTERYEQTKFFTEEARAFLSEFQTVTEAKWTTYSKMIFISAFVKFSGLNRAVTLAQTITNTLREITMSYSDKRWFHTKQRIGHLTFREVLNNFSTNPPSMSSYINKNLVTPAGLTEKSLSLLIGSEQDSVISESETLIAECEFPLGVGNDGTVWVLVPKTYSKPIIVNGHPYQHADTIPDAIDENGDVVALVRIEYNGLVESKLPFVMYGAVTSVTKYPLGTANFCSIPNANPKGGIYVTEMWFDKGGQYEKRSVQCLPGGYLYVRNFELDPLKMSGSEREFVFQTYQGTYFVFKYAARISRIVEWLPGEIHCDQFDLTLLGFTKLKSGHYVTNKVQKNLDWIGDITVHALTCSWLWIDKPEIVPLHIDYAGHSFEYVQEIGNIAVYSGTYVHGLTPTTMYDDFDEIGHEALRSFGYIKNGSVLELIDDPHEELYFDR